LGGYRHTGGSFGGLGNIGSYWVASRWLIRDNRDLYYFNRNDGKLHWGSDVKAVGRSCRCVQD